jgi:hypothetical protein
MNLQSIFNLIAEYLKSLQTKEAEKMDSKFEKAFEFVIKWEGYKSNDPDDVGGRTIFGITEKWEPESVKKMWDLPKPEALNIAKEIYKEDYWNRIKGDTLEYPLYVFDAAVNMGVTYAKQLIGLTLEDMHSKRVRRYQAIALKGNNKKFLKGWLNRENDAYNASK